MFRRDQPAYEGASAVGSTDATLDIEQLNPEVDQHSFENPAFAPSANGYENPSQFTSPLPASSAAGTELTSSGNSNAVGVDPTDSAQPHAEHKASVMIHRDAAGYCHIDTTRHNQAETRFGFPRDQQQTEHEQQTSAAANQDNNGYSFLDPETRVDAVENEYSHLNDDFLTVNPAYQPVQPIQPVEQEEQEADETTVLIPWTEPTSEQRVNSAATGTSNVKPNFLKYLIGTMLAKWDIWKYLIFRAGFSLISLAWFVSAVYEYGRFNTSSTEIALQSNADGEAYLYYLFKVTILNTEDSWINAVAFLFSSTFRLFSSRQLNPSIMASNSTCELPANFSVPFSGLVKIIENTGFLKMQPDPLSQECQASGVAYNILRNGTTLARDEIHLSLSGYEDDNSTLRTVAAFVWIATPIALLFFLNNPRHADNQLRFFNALFWIIGATLMLPFQVTGLILSTLFFCTCFWAPDFRLSVYDKLEQLANYTRYLIAECSSNAKNAALAVGSGVPKKVAFGISTPSSTAMRGVLHNTECVTNDGIKHKAGETVADQLSAETRKLNDEAKKGTVYETDVFGTTVATSRVNNIDILARNIITLIDPDYALEHKPRDPKRIECTRDQLTRQLMDEHQRLDGKYAGSNNNLNIIQQHFTAAHQTLKKTTALLHTDRLPQIIKHYLDYAVKHDKDDKHLMLTLLEHCPVFFSILIVGGVDDALTRIKSRINDSKCFPNRFKSRLNTVHEYYLTNYRTQYPHAHVRLREVFDNYQDIYGPLATQQLPHRQEAVSDGTRSVHNYEISTGGGDPALLLNSLASRECQILYNPGYVGLDNARLFRDVDYSDTDEITWRRGSDNSDQDKDENHIEVIPSDSTVEILNYIIKQKVIINGEPQVEIIVRIKENDSIHDIEYEVQSSDVEIKPAEYDPDSINPLLHKLTKTPVKQQDGMQRNFITAVAVAAQVNVEALPQQMLNNANTLLDRYEQAGLAEKISTILNGINGGDQSSEYDTLCTVCAYFSRPLIIISEKEEPRVIGDNLYPNQPAIFLQKHPLAHKPTPQVEHFDALIVKEDVDPTDYTKAVLASIKAKEDLRLNPQVVTQSQQKWRITLSAKERNDLPTINLNITQPLLPQAKAQPAMQTQPTADQSQSRPRRRTPSATGYAFSLAGSPPAFEYLFDAAKVQDLADFAKGHCDNQAYSDEYVREIETTVLQANAEPGDDLDKIHHDFVKHYANIKPGKAYSTNDPSTQKELHSLGARLAYTLSAELASARQKSNPTEYHKEALTTLQKYVRMAGQQGDRDVLEQEFSGANLSKLYLLLLDPEITGEVRNNTIYAFQRLCANTKYQQKLGCHPSRDENFTIERPEERASNAFA